MQSPRRNTTARAQTQIRQENSIQEFHEMLILAQWALSFFQDGNFNTLRAKLNHAGCEGVNRESQQTLFFEALTAGTLINMNRVSVEAFKNYDRNIIRHWQAITKLRNDNGTALRLKYFQYLSLLVTELYLDWYFNKRAALLDELNDLAARHNLARPNNPIPLKDDTKPGCYVDEDDLRKIAFWEATGAGKTLLMHVNILQYLEYAKEAGKTPDRVVLLTPNEGLSRQHLEELLLSGIDAAFLQENNLLTLSKSKTCVNIVDSGKLISDASTKTKGEKSFFAENFEGNNLVLVDEGHHGSSKEDGEHRRSRDQLCRDGFSIEYSATFGQAVAGTNAPLLKKLYATSILFDYSYKYFHEDGYGKESFILNMPSDEDEEDVFRYLCANLLLFYQQRFLYERAPAVMERFGIEKPLCIFVGGTVTVDNSDVEKIANFFAEVLERRSEVESLFSDFKNDKDVLLVRNINPLRQRFAPLMNKSGKAIYDDMLKKVFNADHVAKLKVHLEKEFDEIIFAVDSEHPFAIVNIGSPGDFIKKLEDKPRFEVLSKEIGESHFSKLNEKSSEISFLVGSRKFTEGWSSWRVSAMGLLNIGVNEGTQIIQLFGRGVRLKGQNFSLKRSEQEGLDDKARKAFVHLLETLQIFGIRANYMANFKAYLEAEGVDTQDSVLTLDFPIKRNKFPSTLMVPQIEDGYRLNQANGFKTQKIRLFENPDEERKKTRRITVKYDDYAYLQILRTSGADASQKDPVTILPVKLDRKAFDFFDWDKIYRTLLEQKARNGYWNLSIQKGDLIEFATNNTDWYELLAKKEDVEFSSFKKLENIERIFTILVGSYMQKFYEQHQHLYEDEHRTMRPLDDSWIPESYQFEIQNNEVGEQWLDRFEDLKRRVWEEDIPYKDFNKWAKDNLNNESFVAIAFDNHIFTPMLHHDKNSNYPFTLSPVLFDAISEVNFVRDLVEFYNSPENRSIFENINLYVMRNASNRLKGLGFAQAGNFYPDFLMWIVNKKTDQQYLTFIDPKGLRNVSFDDPKLNFAIEVKNLQNQVNADSKDKIILNSVILSDTPWDMLRDLFSGHSQGDYEKKNVFFMEDKTGENSYLRKLFKAAQTE